MWKDPTLFLGPFSGKVFKFRVETHQTMRKLTAVRRYLYVKNATQTYCRSNLVWFSVDQIVPSVFFFKISINHHLNHSFELIHNSSSLLYLVKTVLGPMCIRMWNNEWDGKRKIRNVLFPNKLIQPASAFESSKCTTACTSTNNGLNQKDKTGGIMGTLWCFWLSSCLCEVSGTLCLFSI